MALYIITLKCTRFVCIHHVLNSSEKLRKKTFVTLPDFI